MAGQGMHRDAPPPPGASDPRLLLLDERDNVLLACAMLEAGSHIRVEGRQIRLEKAIPLGHKLARRAIAPGARIVKYGAPIGSATAAIAPGQHVHVHNVKSDYTPTYHLIDASDGEVRA